MDQEAQTSVKYFDEQEVFEVRDYTTASEWERFIAAFEEIITEWNLIDEANIVKLHLKEENLSDIKWNEQTTTIKFADYSFNVTHHYVSLDGNTRLNENIPNEFDKKEEMPQYLMQTMNKDVDFASKSHCITRWFGLYQFIILSASPTEETLTSNTRTKLVLSAIAISANNTNCQIPLFIQTRKPEDKVFTGVAISNGLRTDFDMAYVKQMSSRYTDLEGVLGIFKDKVGLENFPPAEVTAKFTYKLSIWTDTQWTQDLPDYDPLSIDFDFSNFTKLPFGAVIDPVSDLFVSTFRSGFNGEFDNPHEKNYRSKLTPDFLNKWSARLTPPNYQSRTLIAGLMKAFLDTSQNQLSIRQILGTEFDPLLAEELNIGSALDKLTSNRVPSLSTVISHASFSRKRHPVTGPLSEDVLTQLLRFLFPDSCDATFAQCYPTEFSQIPEWNRQFEQMSEEHPLKTVLSNMKSCPVDSFIWRLTLVSNYCVMSIGKAAIAQLIYELYLEFRFRWDNSIIVPGVEDCLPNLATCLFNQKMQMLNYCITKRKEKERKYKEFKTCHQEGESEDEFFECNEEADEVSDEEYLPEWDKPVGRLRRLNKLRLMNSRAFLYVPITQEPPPVTEDRLEQQKDDLMRLGSDVTASHQRARMMSISLLSDMESFKAANPGCVLEDFVRWYSPRDWLTDAEGNGRLSERMHAPGNLWQEVWESAGPVPTRRQKRLFDETREFESVLQWVGTLQPGTFCRELLPVLAHACLARITEETIFYTLPASVSILPMPLHCCTLFAQLELVAQRVLRISRQCTPNLTMYEALLEQLRAIEIDITRAKSVRLKILGYTHISSTSFNYSTASSSVETDGNESNQNIHELSHAYDSSLHEHNAQNFSPDLDHAHKPSEYHPSKSPETDTMKSVEKATEEEILEKLVYNLISNQEIVIDDSPDGLQAKVFVKLFEVGVKEIERIKESGETLDRGLKHYYDMPNIFYLGRPFAKEYLIRGKGKFPAGFSRLLPHRMFFVILPSELRMAGAITQDTLFC